MDYHFKCSKHGEYMGTSSRQKCYKCIEIKNLFIAKHPLETEDFITNLDIIKKECKENIEFIEVLIKETNLSVIYWKCNNCGKWFIKHYKNINKLFKSFDENIPIFCSHLCSNGKNIKERTKLGKCIQCNEIAEKRDSVGRCIKCSSDFALKRTKSNQIGGFCFKCGKEVEERDLNGCCLECKPNVLNFAHFKKEENILYYYDKIIENYVKWNEFKEKFKIKNINNDIINDILNNYEKSKFINTFREQNSDSWKGNRLAFEEYLIEQNIGWFVYVKLDELNNPLLAGKSGSKLVNASGSDLSFSEDIEHGPARKFLSDESITWNKTQILIIMCNTESEAYSTEKELQIKYSLFSS